MLRLIGLMDVAYPTPSAVCISGSVARPVWAGLYYVPQLCLFSPPTVTFLDRV